MHFFEECPEEMVPYFEGKQQVERVSCTNVNEAKFRFRENKKFTYSYSQNN